MVLVDSFTTVGHQRNKCRKPLNPPAIAARKAKFLAAKQRMKPEHATKRVLHVLVTGLSSLMNIQSDAKDIDNVLAEFYGCGDEAAALFFASNEKDDPGEEHADHIAFENEPLFSRFTRLSVNPDEEYF